jgi:ribokinase
VARAASLARNGALVILSAAPVHAVYDGLLRSVDVVVVNELEGAQLATRTEKPPSLLVTTLGNRGARAVAGRKEMTVLAPRSKVVDTTGAGDAFVGALAAWLALHDHPAAPLRDVIERALRAAVAAASYSVRALGAQPSYGTAAEVGPPWT